MTSRLALAFALVALACADGRQPVSLDPNLEATNRPRILVAGGTLVLRGTVVTPDSVIKHGYVGIANGRITSVSDKQPNIPDALIVNAHGVIIPGFVDLHNHVPWNVLPRWTPGRTFTNQPDWANDPAFQQVRVPFKPSPGFIPL
jgi:hypothetical protein